MEDGVWAEITDEKFIVNEDGCDDDSCWISDLVLEQGSYVNGMKVYCDDYSGSDYIDEEVEVVDEEEDESDENNLDEDDLIYYVSCDEAD